MAEIFPVAFICLTQLYAPDKFRPPFGEWLVPNRVNLIAVSGFKCALRISR
jgi:hypothetical protein